MPEAAIPSAASLPRDGQDVRVPRSTRMCESGLPCAPRCTYIPVGKETGAEAPVNDCQVKGING
jgi:hypothetical protein